MDYPTERVIVEPRTHRLDNKLKAPTQRTDVDSFRVDERPIIGIQGNPSNGIQSRRRLTFEISGA